MPSDSSSGVPRILMIIVLVAAISVLSILILFYLFGGRRRPHHVSGGGGHGGGHGGKTASPAKLTRGLISRGWVGYFMEECGHCQHQKKLLDLKEFAGHYVETAHQGGATVVVATLDPSVKGRHPPLPLNQVPAFPSWYNLNTGEKRTGFQDEAALSAMAR